MRCIKNLSAGSYSSIQWKITVFRCHLRTRKQTCSVLFSVFGQITVITHFPSDTVAFSSIQQIHFVKDDIIFYVCFCKWSSYSVFYYTCCVLEGKMHLIMYWHINPFAVISCNIRENEALKRDRRLLYTCDSYPDCTHSWRCETKFTPGIKMHSWYVRKLDFFLSPTCRSPSTWHPAIKVICAALSPEAIAS